jgi:hypothetical protein
MGNVRYPLLWHVLQELIISDYKPSLDARAAERAERAQKDKQEQMERLMRDMNMKGASSGPGLSTNAGQAPIAGSGPGKATNPFGPHFRNDREDRYYDDEYLDDGADDDDGGYMPGEREAIAQQEEEEEEAAHAQVFDRQDMGEFALVSIKVGDGPADDLAEAEPAVRMLSRPPQLS